MENPVENRYGDAAADGEADSRRESQPATAAVRPAPIVELAQRMFGAEVVGRSGPVAEATEPAAVREVPQCG
jgi:hypothetical protein